MLEKIINSKTRLTILSLIFANQDKNFYAQEIVNKTGLDPANVKKELDNLASGGFLIIKKEKGKKVFELNKGNELYGGLNLLFSKHQERLNMEKWFVIEEIVRVNPNITISYSDYLFNKEFLKKEFGINKVCRTVVPFENGTCELCHVKKEFREMAQEVFDNITNDHNWGLKVNAMVKNMADEWQKTASEVYNANLGSLSNEELARLYRRFYSGQARSHASGWPANVVDFEDSMFSKHLMKILEEKRKGLKINVSTGEAFSILTTPTEKSLAQDEYRDLINILAKIYEDEKAVKLFAKNDSRIIEDKLKSSFSALYNLINQHQKDFGWLSYGFEGPAWQNIYFIDILASLIRQKADPKKILADLDSKDKKIEELQKKYKKEFYLSANEIGLFEVAKGFVFMKGYRKDRMFYSLFCLEFLLREAARRLYLSLQQVRQIYEWEFEDTLLEGSADVNELNKRIAFHVFYSDSEGNHVISGDEGKKFFKSLDFVKQNLENVSQLMGDTASPGKVRGIVKIVIYPDDMKKIKDGDILVSIATTPELVPAIKKSGAIVTDMGGVTCHAAIVSREMGIPCVIGTKIATKILKDGDVVEVDANHGKVTILKKK